MAEGISAAQAARLLGISERRVRELVETGALPAERVGERTWLISADAVRRRASRAPSPGRPLSSRLAWHVLAHVQHRLDGAEPDFSAVSDRRLRYQLKRLLSEPKPSGRWAQSLARRAERRRLWVHPGVVGDLLADERVHVGGAAAAGSLGLSFGGGARRVIYVNIDHVKALTSQYGLVDDPSGDIELMAAPPEAAMLISQRGPVPTAVALADLLESEDARERTVAAAKLEAIGAS